MKEEDEKDLDSLFLEAGEVERDEVFVHRVSKRIALRRCARLGMKTVFAGVALAVLAWQMPVLTDLTYGIAVGSGFLARSIVAVALSPIGCVIGGGAGLILFLRLRS